MGMYYCPVGCVVYVGFQYCITLPFNLTHPFLSIDVPFPKNFMQICKKIFTRLYRVFVHVYIHHFDKLIAIGAVSVQVYIMYLLMYMCLYMCIHLYRKPISTLATNIFISL